MKLFNIMILLLLAGCSFLKSNEKEYVVNVGGNGITFDELLAEYQANSENPDSVTFDDLNNFANLYADFMAKLASAREGGYFKDPDILKELTSYESQYAIPYWMRKEIENKLLTELFTRAQFEIKSSHILIALSEEAIPADTLKAYNKLLKAREKWIEGTSTFEDLNKQYSTVRMGRSMGGELGYISAGTTVKAFEDVLYSTPIDSLSMPFRTQFGMHILKVLEKRPKTPDRKISHIFFRIGRNDTTIDTLLKGKALDAYKALVKGEKWNDVVQTYSMDQQTASNAGSLGWVKIDQYGYTFSSKAFGLAKPGGFSEPFYSGYGVHIIKLDSIRTYLSNNHEREELLKTLKRLPRYKNNKKVVLEEIKKNSQIRYFHKNADLIKAHYQDTAKANMRIQNVALPDSMLNMPIFTINSNTYIGMEYSKWISETKIGMGATEYRYFWYNEFVDEMVERELVPLTKKRFPDFAKTANDYLNGLVVFKITEDSVWNLSRQDTASLFTVYQKNHDKYQFETRYEFARYATNSDSLINFVRTEYEKGNSPDSVKAQNPNLYIISDMTTDVTDFPFSLLSYMKPGDYTQIFDFKNRKNIMYLKNILPPGPMSFDDAFFRVVSDFQPEREKQWLNSLRERFNATINNSILKAKYNLWISKNE